MLSCKKYEKRLKYFLNEFKTLVISNFEEVFNFLLMDKSVLEIHPVRYGKGALLVSTPQGVMTDKEEKKAKVGGEALFEIW